MSMIPEPKYQTRWNGADPALLPDAEAAFVDFRLERMNPAGLAGQVRAVLGLLLLRLVLWFGRNFAPWLRIGRWLIVTRHADVEHVLNYPGQFNTPFNPEMKALAGDATFMLGLDGSDHLRQRRFVQHWLQAHDADGQDALARFRQDCATASAALLDNAPGEIDVMQDYFTRVSSEAGARLLGLPVDDPEAFGAWTIALSAMIFGDATGDKVVRELASHGGWQMRGLIDRAIVQQRAMAQPPAGLIAACLNPGPGQRWTDAEIRALVIGVATGHVPTVTLMAGNILTWLLEHPNVLHQAQAAAVANDRTQLRAILLEVGRLRPALWPGQFRLVNHEIKLPNGRTLPANTAVLAATATALRDPVPFFRPDEFRLGRPLDGDSVNLTFGAMPHACLGRALATAQLEEMFAALLGRPGLMRAPGRAGRLRRVQAFPRHLTLRFANPARPGGHSMAMVVVPLHRRADAAALQTAVTALGNPAGEALDAALKAAGGIHFFSLNLVDAGTPDAPEWVLLLELNADGDQEAALYRLADAADALLAPIFAAAGWLRHQRPLGAFLQAHVRTTSRWPFGFTGLDYNGTVGFSLPDKQQQRDLAQFAARALDWVQRQRLGSGGRPMARLEAVRALIRGDVEALTRVMQDTHAPPPGKVASTQLHDEHQLLLRGGALFRPMLMLPSGRRLPFIDHLEQSQWRQLGQFLQSADARPFWLLALALLAIGTAMLAGTLVGGGLLWLARLAGALMMAIILLLASALLAGLLLFLRLRTLEKADRPDDRDADPAHVARLIAREDAPGFQQNHVLSLSVFKAGWLRRLSFAFAMWGIGIYCRWLARPGFILSMGTIHFARWYRLPSRDGGRLMFHSNYDGNWESYLEDFVMKAHIGQTAAWSHGGGFPRTEALILKGAQDGPRFKRWTRRQQQVTQCWWSATPGLTLDRIRTNALIHDGLARAKSDSAAREWMALFGSQTRPQAAIESEDVQTIVFRGMGRLHHGLTIGLMLAGNVTDARAQLRLLLGDSVNTASGLPAIAFGERPWGGSDPAPVGSIAVSAAGLVRLGLSGSADDLSGFPFAFRQGMRARWRQLRDPDGTDWQIDDSVHVLLHYLFSTPRQAADALAAIQEHFGPSSGGSIAFVQASGPSPHPVSKRPSVAFEPFGFRDGISQPVIRGSLGESMARPDNLLEPGEFILGYRTNQGQVAPGPRVHRQDDARDHLPDVTVEPDQAWPAFRRQQLGGTAWRDFGRNGSFLVLRQFEQDVPGFRRFCIEQAAELRRQYPGLKTVVGTAITSRWLAGKLVGRWQDGIALNRRPRPPGKSAAGFVDSPDVSVRLGREDARGFGCPLGAHVRRANPRDSLLPDDPQSMEIANRHRLIRRGRAWWSETGAGLTFIALCADIERQFEFIQAQWLAAPSFHGLADEVDPLVIGDSSFTIPTSAGPLRINKIPAYVTLVGGGYFFLPSRSALRFLTQPTFGKQNGPAPTSATPGASMRALGTEGGPDNRRF